jgi:hypothetical protein
MRLMPSSGLFVSRPVSPRESRGPVRSGGALARSAGRARERPGRPVVWAMCAIDVLGIPQMADRDATTTAADPSTGVAVTVEARDRRWLPTPAGTVVLVAQTGRAGRGRSAAAGTSTAAVTLGARACISTSARS